MHKHITLKPKLSEKTYAQSTKGVYAFEVPRDVNKHSVARAIEEQFEVAVREVNIVNHHGKAKRTLSKGGRRSAQGREAATKKAYVTLVKGQSLPFFAAVEEAEEKQADTQAQMEKAAEKAEKPKRGRRTKSEETN